MILFIGRMNNHSESSLFKTKVKTSATSKE